MGDKPNKEDAAKIQSLHPAYYVSNINNKIRTLDGNKITYSSWVKFFKLHATTYKVMNHIDDTPKPNNDDAGYEEWKEIDALVLQWIYSTVSDDLVVQILENDTTVKAAWNKVKNVFLNNKGSRAASLEHEFTNLTLSKCSSIDDYCQKLKDIAEQLGDVDNPVSDSRLVLQMVRGLPSEYEVLATFINQSSPTWDVARSMLQLEQHRQAARPKENQSAMVTPQTAHSTPNPIAPNDQNRPQYYQQYDQNRPRGRGRGNQWRGGRNRGRGRGSGHRSTGPQWTGSHWTYHAPAPYGQWQPPPRPYPSQAYNGVPPQATHKAHFTPTQHSQSHVMPASQSQFGQYALNALSPTDLSQAFQHMQVPPDQTWYMDTVASSHLTANPGSQDTYPPFPPQ